MAHLTDEQVTAIRTHGLQEGQRATLAQLCDDLLAARKVLRSVEFAACPCCLRVPKDGHADDCEWADAMGVEK